MSSSVKNISTNWFADAAKGSMKYVSIENTEDVPSEIVCEEILPDNSINSKSLLHNFGMSNDNSSFQNLLPPETSIVYLPFYGRIHFVFNAQGLSQLIFIILYWMYGSFTSLFIILLPMYFDGRISIIAVGVFGFISVCCITSLFRASTMNPGRVREKDCLEYNESERQFCPTCNFPRPPRSHHCRKCRHCVTKMDHHCHWINNCVGQENQHMFMLLLFYAVVISVTTFILDILFFFYFPECQSCNKELFYMQHKTGMVRGAFALACFMIAAGISLLAIQVMNIVFDMTTIDWMLLHQKASKGGFTSDLLPKQKNSYMGALRASFGTGNCLLWLLPCRTRSLQAKYTFSTV